MKRCGNPYRGEAGKEYSLFADDSFYFNPNTIYKKTIKGQIWFFYITEKGFLHILKADRVLLKGKNNYAIGVNFTVSDYYLTSGNSFKFYKNIPVNCKTLKEAKDFISMCENKKIQELY